MDSSGGTITMAPATSHTATSVAPASVGATLSHSVAHVSGPMHVSGAAAPTQHSHVARAVVHEAAAGISVAMPVPQHTPVHQLRLPPVLHAPVASADAGPGQTHSVVTIDTAAPYQQDAQATTHTQHPAPPPQVQQANSGSQPGVSAPTHGGDGAGGGVSATSAHGVAPAQPAAGRVAPSASAHLFAFAHPPPTARGATSAAMVGGGSVTTVGVASAGVSATASTATASVGPSHGGKKRRRSDSPSSRDSGGMSLAAAPPRPPRRAGRPRDSVWQFFDSLGRQRARCHFCTKEFSGTGTRLRIHLSKCVSCPPQTAAMYGQSDGGEFGGRGMKRPRTTPVYRTVEPNRKRCGRPRDTAWKFFLRLGKQRVKCVFCRKEFSATGTRLRLHLAKCTDCPAEINTIIRNKRARDGKPVGPAPVPRAKNGSSGGRKVKGEPGSQDPLSESKRRQIDNAVVTCVTRHAFDARLLDQPAFRALIRTLRPDYRLLSADAVKKQVAAAAAAPAAAPAPSVAAQSPSVTVSAGRGHTAAAAAGGGSVGRGGAAADAAVVRVAASPARPPRDKRPTVRRDRDTAPAAAAAAAAAVAEPVVVPALVPATPPPVPVERRVHVVTPAAVSTSRTSAPATHVPSRPSPAPAHVAVAASGAPTRVPTSTPVAAGAVVPPQPPVAPVVQHHVPLPHHPGPVPTSMLAAMPAMQAPRVVMAGQPLPQGMVLVPMQHGNGPMMVPLVVPGTHMQGVALQPGQQPPRRVGDMARV